MSAIFSLVHILCNVTYVLCSWRILHSSVDLGDLTRVLFPILGESTIPKSINLVGVVRGQRGRLMRNPRYLVCFLRVALRSHPEIIYDLSCVWSSGQTSP